MSREFKITMDGLELTAREGETILDVAKAAEIHIPTLCHHPRLRNTGACRVCVVEVEGARALMPSCVTPVDRDAMVVHTRTERVLSSRKLTVELLIASGNHDCPNCHSNGACELQDLAEEMEIEHPRFPVESPGYPADNSNPMIVRDLNKCVLCGRCVRGCQEVQVNQVIECGFRGPNSKIVTGGDTDYGESECVFCGECVQLCPVGAISEKQRGPFGKAWEEEKVRSVCTYCGTGCVVNLHTINGRVVRVTGDEDSELNRGSLCVKGRFGYDFIHHEDRLTQPLIREGDRFREATWDEALTRVAEGFGKIKREHGGKALAGFSSARVTNEENYLFMKFLRTVLTTQNVDHCARLCQSVSVAGLAAAFGSGAMTNSIAELEDTDVILLTGSNPTENHPVISNFMKRGIVQNGTQLIVVDPRGIDMTRFATHWLRQRPGSDVAWINGMMHVILEEGLYDREFVEKRTEGFDALREVLKKYTPAHVEEISGIPADDLVAAARLYGSAERASICYAMGITQHTTGTDNVKSLANLAMLCGNMGIPGGGVNQLRGQNNVQGACDMGALPNVYTGYQMVGDEAAQEKFSKAWGVKLPDKPGLTLLEILNAAHAGEMKGLFVMGENPMVSDPNTAHVEESLKRLDLLVVQDLFLTETARLAHVVLPAVSFAEKEGTFTNTERRVQRVRKAEKTVGHDWPDWKILTELARKMDHPWPYESAEDIFEEIRSLTPSYAGITYERIEKEGLQWPCPNEEHPGTVFLHRDRFTRGLGLFHAVEYIPPHELPDDDFPLILTTGRVLYQYHTASMTGRCEGLQYLYPKAYVEVSEQDAEKLGLEDEGTARVSSRRGSIEISVRVTDRSAPGTVFIPFHFYETAANRLTHSDKLDPVGKIPEYKVCAVKIEAVKPSVQTTAEEAAAPAP
jgi:formate dehydrogenase alpha subunit